MAVARIIPVSWSVCGAFLNSMGTYSQGARVVTKWDGSRALFDLSSFRNTTRTLSTS
jgi:hypothetical protein